MAGQQTQLEQPRSDLSTSNWHCANFLRYAQVVREKLTGWKQGHTPAELSEPLPLAGVLFWLLLPSLAHSQELQARLRYRSRGCRWHHPVWSWSGLLEGTSPQIPVGGLQLQSQRP